MELPNDYQPEFETLKDLLLEMIQERSLDSLLSLIVRRFAKRPHLALARIWLLRPGDKCQKCSMFADCKNQHACLHLVASAGRTLNFANDWSLIDDCHSRLPLGQSGIGQIASLGKKEVIFNIEKDPGSLTNLSWIQKEEIKGFSGTPLIYRGETMGVLAIYTRIPIPNLIDTSLFHMVVEHAAGAIANAHAFEEIERLKRKLEVENASLKEDARITQSSNYIIGSSSALKALRQKIEHVAPTNASVLVTGETGTGKELVAREIHIRSLRKEKALIKVNCPSIPSELWESEFFGHVKGAFTGALKDRTGRFELANGGTLFLDEVGEIPLDQQSRLLRVLQEGQFERVGAEETTNVDVRIIAATNRDLEQEVAAGRFRKDLYYRLNVFPIEVVPLRQHKEDIPDLAKHFLEQSSIRFGRKTPNLCQECMDSLMEYDWRGNVRELQNVVERAIITTNPDLREIKLTAPSTNKKHKTTVPKPLQSATSTPKVLTMAQIKKLEEENIRAALEQTGGKIYGPNGAAQLLGMKPTTLSSKLQKLQQKLVVE